MGILPGQLNEFVVVEDVFIFIVTDRIVNENNGVWFELVQCVPDHGSNVDPLALAVETEAFRRLAIVENEGHTTTHTGVKLFVYPVRMVGSGRSDRNVVD